MPNDQELKPCPLTPEQIAKWKALCDAATKGPWDKEGVLSEGSYGSGEDVQSGFCAYEIRAGKEVLFDSLNSTASSIREEYDSEDGGGATWDEVAEKNLEFVALARTALPAALDALTAANARIAELEKQLALPPVQPVGEWRVWKKGGAHVADNGTKCRLLPADGDWFSVISDDPRWYQRNGWTELTSPAEVAAIIATLPKEVRG